MEILQNLNKEQREAVQSTEGPVLILAGAGSGKTRTIIHRAAYLIREKMVDPGRIMILTFTNKAANELKERLFNEFSLSAHSLWVGTFHSVFSMILRIEAKNPGVFPFTSNYSIYDSDDQKSLLKKVYKKLNLDKAVYNLNSVSSIISRNKNNLITPQNYFDYYDETHYTKVFHSIYKCYQESLIENNALDFDDLLLYTAFMFDKYESIREKYSSRFSYLMVDEYQDTNFAQFRILYSISKDHQNICVVGDDDQSIYSWRGANIENILNFEKDFKGVKMIKLEQNYRSTTDILSLSNKLISHNPQRHKKKLWTAIPEGEKPDLSIAENEYEEAGRVAHKIKLALEKGTLHDDIAVLYRTNSQALPIESTLNDLEIPNKIFGSISFYQRKEIKELIAYLRFLSNPDDDESFVRIINFPPRGIGLVTLNNFIQFKREKKLNSYEALKIISEQPEIKISSQKKLAQFFKKVAKIRQSMDSLNCLEVIDKVINDFDILNHYRHSSDPKDEYRIDNIEDFLNSAGYFFEEFVKDYQKSPTLEEFLQKIALYTSTDRDRFSKPGINLMTLHNAKGLEFDIVFITGLEEGLLPHSRSISESKQALDEERRLLYVGITRARKMLYLSYAESRRSQLYGFSNSLPSRFLSELGLDFNKTVNYLHGHRNKEKKKQPKKIITESQKFYKIGHEVYHREFGDGVILSVNGEGKDAVLTVSFINGVLKKIIGSYLEPKSHSGG